MLIRDLFASDVTRDIPPVVYFHEQSPPKLAQEVGEYIITGGWPANHPHHRRVPDGIHEQYVKLLTSIATELDKPGGPEPPNAWISGFYGSGKSSFAKLLGLSRSTESRSRAAARLRRPGSAATRRPSPPSCAPRGRSYEKRSTRWRSSSTSAARRATTSTSTPRRCARCRSASGTALPSRSSPTSSSSSSATASGALRGARAEDSRW
jgi:hypothetical protein